MIKGRKKKIKEKARKKEKRKEFSSFLTLT